MKLCGLFSMQGSKKQSGQREPDAGSLGNSSIVDFDTSVGGSTAVVGSSEECISFIVHSHSLRLGSFDIADISPSSWPLSPLD